jgi:hypothetical protein
VVDGRSVVHVVKRAAVGAADERSVLTPGRG